LDSVGDPNRPVLAIFAEASRERARLLGRAMRLTGSDNHIGLQETGFGLSGFRLQASGFGLQDSALRKAEA